MTPTNKLRFVERDCYIKNGESFVEPFKQRILQQWWEDTWTEFDPDKNLSVHKGKGEWRDIPLEEET